MPPSFTSRTYILYKNVGNNENAEKIKLIPFGELIKNVPQK